jgi:hypothetical protein
MNLEVEKAYFSCEKGSGVEQQLTAPTHPQNTRPSQLTKPVFQEQKQKYQPVCLPVVG